MTVVALDYEAQLRAHMSAAEKANGAVIVKSEAFFGRGLNDEAVRKRCLHNARSHGFKAQFTRSHGQWTLRLAKRKDGQRT